MFLRVTLRQFIIGDDARARVEFRLRSFLTCESNFFEKEPPLLLYKSPFFALPDFYFRIKLKLLDLSRSRSVAGRVLHVRDRNDVLKALKTRPGFFRPASPININN